MQAVFWSLISILNAKDLTALAKALGDKALSFMESKTGVPFKKLSVELKNEGANLAMIT